MAEEKDTGFNPETYSHVLPEGIPDFDDYTEEDLQQDPELGLTDEEVAAEVAKLRRTRSFMNKSRRSQIPSTGSTGTSSPLQI